MNKGLNKILGIVLVVGMILSSMMIVATNVGSGEDEEEIEIENLNPDSAKDEYIHLVWQENISHYNIFYANDKNENFKVELKSAIREIQAIRDKDTKAEKSMEKINEALNLTIKQEYEKSFESVKHAIQNLQQSNAETEEIVSVLYNSVKDFTKCNLLYSQSLVGLNNSYVQKSWEHYYKAIEFMDNDESSEEKYEGAIEQFKGAYKESLKAKGEWVPENYVENIQEALNGIQILMDSTTDKKALKELEKSKDELNNALEKVNSSENDRLEKSFDNIKKAIGYLEKAEKEGVDTFEIRCWLMITVKDAIDTIVKSQLLVKNTYFEKAKKEYDSALEYMRDYEFDSAIQHFKTTLQHIKNAVIGVEFGKIVKVSSTSYDSVSPKIYLNGEISVGWIEKTPDENHVLYARSEDGLSWWYLDANEYASTYLCYAGIDPSLVNIENMLTITRTLERIWILDKCHYFYAPIIRDGFTIEDRRVYAPINDPYLTIYDGNYEPIYIGDKKFYIICGGPHPLPPPKAPDLTITDITYSPGYPVIAQTTTLIVNVKNIGDASASNIEVAVYDDDTLFRGNTIECLDANQSTQISIPYTFSSIGTHTITAIADPNNNINEGDESNNKMTKNIDVATQSLALPMGAGDVTMLSSDDFDDGNANGWALSGLWHVTSWRKYSGSYSLAYNQESSHNYNTGSRTYGSAEFSVDLSAASTATLTFQTWWEHEFFSYEGYDFDYDSMDVDIYDSSWHNLWHRDCDDGPSQSDWHQELIDISTYAGGTVKIRFKFDSVDSAYNYFEGWYIDDVNVATGGTTTETFGSWTETWTGQNRGRGNVYSVTSTVTLSKIEMYLDVPTSTTLYYAVYEGTAVTGTFTKVFETSKSSGTGEGWYSSGAVSCTLQSGKYYLIVTWWGGVSIKYGRGGSVPVATAFGELKSGIPDSPSASTPPSSWDMTYSGFSPYYQRITTIGSTPSNSPPTASFTYTPSSPTKDDTIQFTDQSTDSDGYIASWSWNFGDGSTSTSQNPTHKYSSAGTYTVTLTVVDEDGGAASCSKTIFVCGLTYFRWYWSIDSPHNYPNNYDKTWTVTQPGVNIKLITFSKIDLENGCDYLYVYDKNNNLLYSLTGYKGGISYSINVDTDTVKLRLVTSNSVPKWGFQLECIMWAESATESPHPYSNNYDNTWTITKSNANKIRIHFTSDTEVEKNYDYLYLYDGSGNQIWKKTGALGEFWTGWVNGDTVKVRLTTDYSITKYGFYVDIVDCEPKKYSYGTLGIQHYDHHDVVGDVLQVPEVIDEIHEWLYFSGKSEACWVKQFDERNSSVERGDYTGDASSDIDGVDFAVSIGHGIYPYSDDSVIALHDYGDTDPFDWDDTDEFVRDDDIYSIFGDHRWTHVKWVMLLHCYILKKSEAGEWANALNGCHGVCGYWESGNPGKSTMEKFFEYAIDYGYPISDAWYIATVVPYQNMNDCGAIMAESEQQLYYDHLPGEGTMYSATPDSTYYYDWWGIAEAQWSWTFDFIDPDVDPAIGWTLSGLWHATSYRSDSSPNSLVYNQESTHNYDTGATNSGNAITPVIPLPSTEKVTLEFQSWYETEDTGTYWDKKLVYISTDGGSTWSANPIYQVSGSTCYKQWGKVTIDLSSYSGKEINLKFRFDTVDGAFNKYEGWYIDDIKIYGTQE